MQGLNSVIKDGLVRIDDYECLVNSKTYKNIELFSNDFINKTGSFVKNFDKRWVVDPLHQWSRQWEYPYIISKAMNLKKNAKIIDLGAGMSFLTYFLQNKLGLKNITAIDYDKTLTNLYNDVNNKMDANIKFKFGDMRNLKTLESNSADYIYSVSALEHTDGYTKILKEIYRILKKGGKLSLTFDISINNLDEISVNRAKELIKSVEKVFCTNTGVKIKTAIEDSNLVTTRYIASVDKKLMPWKYPLINVIKPIIKHRKIGSSYKNLTFCCLTVEKI